MRHDVEHYHILVTDCEMSAIFWRKKKQRNNFLNIKPPHSDAGDIQFYIILMFFLFAFICITLLSSCTHLHYMQLWQQVTVRQGHLVAIQEVAVGHLDVLDAVVVDLIGKWRAEVFVQLLQRLQESTLQSCTKTMDNLCMLRLYADSPQGGSI